MSISHSNTVTTLKDESGNRYNGKATSGSNTGTFTCITAGGTSVYIGEHSNGMFNGKGLLKYANGISHECEWRDSKQHGVGVFRRSQITLATESSESSTMACG